MNNLIGDFLILLFAASITGFVHCFELRIFESLTSAIKDKDHQSVLVHLLFMIALLITLIFSYYNLSQLCPGVLYFGVGYIVGTALLLIVKWMRGEYKCSKVNE